MTDKDRSTLPVPVALRAERDRVIDRLCDGYARELLDMDEFERRVTLAHAAGRVEELAELARDLGEEKPATGMVRHEHHAVPASRVPARQSTVAVMGGTSRGGRWVVPRRLDAVAVMGGCELDFREAALGPGVTEVRVTAVMGGVNMVVPPWLHVEMNGVAIMGGFEHCDRAPLDLEEDAPVLRISGVAVMGGVNIETRLPGENRRHARARGRKAPKDARGETRLLVPGDTPGKDRG